MDKKLVWERYNKEVNFYETQLKLTKNSNAKLMYEMVLRRLRNLKKELDEEEISWELFVEELKEIKKL